MNSKEERFKNSISGIILGTAVGDSLGLPFEGLSKKTVAKIITSRLRQCFFFGRGMVSDDTDLVVLTGQAFGDTTSPEGFLRCLAWRYRIWVLFLPAGIGAASLRSGLKLLIGYSPFSSGVFSAGNAPALRSAILGALFYDQPELRSEYVRLSTRMTHTDPKALTGALATSNVFAFAVKNIVESNTQERPGITELAAIMLATDEHDEQWNKIVTLFADSVEKGLSASEYAKELGCEKGITGFIFNTVSVAIYSWYVNYDHPDKTIQDVIFCGGDTDTTAAIAGALAGCCHYGKGDFLSQWLEKINDFPCSVPYLKRLAIFLSGQGIRPPVFHWWFLPFRNLFFLCVVMLHVLLRVLNAVKVPTGFSSINRKPKNQEHEKEK